jgi:uncharacterized membrane protein
MSWYFVSVTIHVLAAMLWLGGLLFLAAVGAPVLRRVEPASLRAELFERLGTQFRNVGWVAIAVLVVTGVANLYFRGLLNGEIIKLGTVITMVVLSAIHDFKIGPAASRAPPGSPEALRLRARSAWVARINAVVGVVLVAAAVRLARGV